MDLQGRCDAIDAGLRQFGFDFFMVDGRTDVIVHAASWHIENEEDCNTFREFASSFIPWEARQSAGASVTPTVSVEKFYDLIVRGDAEMSA